MSQLCVSCVCHLKKIIEAVVSASRVKLWPGNGSSNGSGKALIDILFLFVFNGETSGFVVVELP